MQRAARGHFTRRGRAVHAKLALDANANGGHPISLRLGKRPANAILTSSAAPTISLGICTRDDHGNASGMGEASRAMGEERTELRRRSVRVNSTRSLRPMTLRTGWSHAPENQQSGRRRRR